MKKMIIRIAMVLIFTCILFMITDLKIQRVLDLKSLLLVVLGTAFLTIGNIRRPIQRNEIFSAISWNAFVVSYLVTFINLFLVLSKRDSSSELFGEIANGCVPLLYGFLLHVFFKEASHHTEKLREDTSPQPSAINAEELYFHYIELGLTRKEAEIARLAKSGRTNKEIAEEMYIAESTVKKHMTHIFQKLSIDNRSQL